MQAESAIEAKPYQDIGYQFVGPEASRYSFPEMSETVESKQGIDSTTSHARAPEPETYQAVNTYQHSGSFNTIQLSSGNFVVALVVLQLSALYVVGLPALELLQYYFQAKFLSLWNAKFPSQKP